MAGSRPMIRIGGDRDVGEVFLRKPRDPQEIVLRATETAGGSKSSKSPSPKKGPPKKPADSDSKPADSDSEAEDREEDGRRKVTIQKGWLADGASPYQVSVKQVLLVAAKDLECEAVMAGISIDPYTGRSRTPEQCLEVAERLQAQIEGLKNGSALVPIRDISLKRLEKVKDRMGRHIMYKRSKNCCGVRKRYFTIDNGRMSIWRYSWSKKPKHVYDLKDAIPTFENKNMAKGMLTSEPFVGAYQSRVQVQLMERRNRPIYLYADSPAQAKSWSYAIKLSKFVRDPAHREAFAFVVGRVCQSSLTKGWEALFRFSKEIKDLKATLKHFSLKLMHRDLGRGWSKVRLLYLQRRENEKTRQRHLQLVMEFLQEKVKQVAQRKKMVQGTGGRARGKIISGIQDAFRNVQATMRSSHGYPLGNLATGRVQQALNGEQMISAFKCVTCKSALRLALSDESFEMVQKDKQLSSSRSTYTAINIPTGPRQLQIADNFKMMSITEVDQVASHSHLKEQSWAHFVNLDQISSVVLHAERALTKDNQRWALDPETCDGVWFRINGPRVSWCRKLSTTTDPETKVKKTKALGAKNGFELAAALATGEEVRAFEVEITVVRTSIRSERNRRKADDPFAAELSESTREGTDVASSQKAPESEASNSSGRGPQPMSYQPKPPEEQIQAVYLPMKIGGVPILFKEAGTENTWQLSLKELDVDTETAKETPDPELLEPAVSFRSKKQMDAKLTMDSPHWGDSIDGYDEGDGWLKCWVKVRKDAAGETRLSLHFLGRRFLSEKLSSIDPMTFPGTFRVQVPVSDDAEALAVLDEAELGVDVVEWVQDPWPHWRTIYAGRALFQDLFRYAKGKDKLDDGTTNYETISAYSGISRPQSEAMTEASDGTVRTPREDYDDDAKVRAVEDESQAKGKGMLGIFPQGKSNGRPGQTRPEKRSLTELLPEGHGSAPVKISLSRPWDEAGQITGSPETLELRATARMDFVGDHACISPELQGRGVLTTLYSAHRGMWYDPTIGQKSFHLDNVANFVELSILDLAFPNGDRVADQLFMYFVEASICGINASTVPLYRPLPAWTSILPLDAKKINFQGAPLVLPLPPGFWCFHGAERRPTIELTVLRIATNDLPALTYRELLSRSGKRARETPSLERVYHANLLFEGLLVDETREGVGVRLSKASQPPTEAHISTGDCTKVEDPALVRLTATLRDRDYVRLSAAKSGSVAGGKREHGQQAALCVGDKVLVPFEEPILYPRTEVEYRKRLLPGSYVENAWEASANEWEAPLRDPYLAQEYDASGMDKLSVGNKISQRVIPRDCQDVIPHKFVMPSSEMDFIKEGRPGVFWRVVSKLAENPQSGAIFKEGSRSLALVSELTHLLRQVPCTVLAVYSDRTCDVELPASFLIEWEHKPWKRFKVPGAVVVKEFEMHKGVALARAAPGQGDISGQKRLRVLLKGVSMLDVISVQATSFNIYDARLGSSDDAISIDPSDIGNDFNPCEKKSLQPLLERADTALKLATTAAKNARTLAGTNADTGAVPSMPPGSEEMNEWMMEIRGGYAHRAGPVPFDVGQACQHEWSLYCHARSEDEMYQFVTTLRQMVKLDLESQMQRLKEFSTDIAGRKQYRSTGNHLSGKSGTLEVVLVETKNLRPPRVQQDPSLMKDRQLQKAQRLLNVTAAFRLKRGNLKLAPDKLNYESRYLPKTARVPRTGSSDFDDVEILIPVDGQDDEWELVNTELKSKDAFFPYFIDDDYGAVRDTEGPAWGTIVKGEEVGADLDWIRCEVVTGRTLKFLVDERVESCRIGGLRHQRYGAIITRVNTDNTYTIKWDDGHAKDCVKQGQELSRKEMEVITYKGSKQQNSSVLNSSNPNWSEDKELQRSGGWIFKTPVLDPSQLKGMLFELEMINKKAYSTETIGFARLPLNSVDARNSDLPFLELCDPDQPFHNIWLPLCNADGESVSGEVHIMTLWVPKNPARNGKKKFPATPQKFMERDLAVKMHQLVPRDPIYNFPIRQMGYNPNLSRGDTWPETLSQATSFHVQGLFNKAPYLACCDRQVQVRLDEKMPEFQAQLKTLQDERQTTSFKDDALAWERTMKVNFYELNELLRRGVSGIDRKDIWLDLMCVEEIQDEARAGSFRPDDEGETDIESALIFYKELVTKGKQRSNAAMRQLNEDFISAACWERSESPVLMDLHMKRLQRTYNLCTALIAFSAADADGPASGPSARMSGRLDVQNTTGGSIIYCESIFIIAFHVLLAFEPHGDDAARDSGEESMDWEDECRAFWVLWGLGALMLSGQQSYSDYFGMLPFAPPKYDAGDSVPVATSTGQADCGDWGCGAMRDVLCLSIMLEREEYDLWVHLNALGFHLSTVFYGAFMRLFAFILPTSSLFRFWDLLFADILRPSRQRRALVELGFAGLRECKLDLMRCVAATEARDCLLTFYEKLYDESRLVQLVATVEGENFWGGVIGRGIGWKEADNYISNDKLSMMQTYEQTMAMWHIYFEHTRYQNSVLREFLAELDEAGLQDGDENMRANTRNMMRVIIPKLQNQSSLQGWADQASGQYVGLMRQTPPRLYELSAQGGVGQFWRQAKQSFSAVVSRREAAKLDLKTPFLVGVPPSAGARGERLLDHSSYEMQMQQSLGLRAESMGSSAVLGPATKEVWRRFIPELGGKFSRMPDHRLCLPDIYLALICCSSGTLGEKALALFDVFGTVQPGNKVRHVVPMMPSAGVVIQQVEGVSNARTLMAAPSKEDERKMALHFRVYSYSGAVEMIVGDAYVPDLHPYTSSGLGSPPVQKIVIWGLEKDLPPSMMALARGPARMPIGELAISIQWIPESNEQQEVGQLRLHLNSVRLDVDRPEKKNPRVTVVGRDERGAEIQFKREDDLELAKGSMQYMSVVARDMTQASLNDHIEWPNPMWMDPMSMMHSYRGLGDQGWDKASGTWKWSTRWGVQFSVKHLPMPGTREIATQSTGDGKSAISLAACRTVTRGILERSLHCVTNRQAALISDQIFSRAGAVPGILDAVLVKADSLKEEVKTVVQLREQLTLARDYIDVKFEVTMAHENQVALTAGRLDLLMAHPTLLRGPHAGDLPLSMGAATGNAPTNHASTHQAGAGGSHIGGMHANVTADLHLLQDSRGFAKGVADSSMNGTLDFSGIFGASLGLSVTRALDRLTGSTSSSSPAQPTGSASLQNINIQDPFKGKKKVLWIRYVRAGDGERFNAKIPVDEEGKFDIEKYVKMEMPTDSASGQVQSFISKEEFVNCFLQSPLLGETLRRVSRCADREGQKDARHALSLDIMVSDPDKVQQDEDFSDMMTIGQRVLFELWDYDRTSKNDFLGECWLPSLVELTSGQRKTFRLQIGNAEEHDTRPDSSKASNAENKGILAVEALWTFPAEAVPDVPVDSIEERVKVEEKLHTGILRLRIIEAENIRAADVSRRRRSSDSYIRCYLQNETISNRKNSKKVYGFDHNGFHVSTKTGLHEPFHTTKTKEKTLNPVWNESTSITVKTGAFEMKTTQNARKNAFSTSRQIQDDLDRRVLAGNAEVEIKFRETTGGAGQSHSEKVYMAETILQFKEKLKRACIQEARATQDMAEKSRFDAVANSMSSRHLVMVFVPSERLRDLKQQNINFGREYKRLERIEHMDPSHWQPLDPIRTFASYAKEFGFGTDVQQLQIAEATPAYAVKNVRYRRFEDERQRALLRTNLQGLNTEAECFGYAKYVHRQDGNSTEWRPVIVERAADEQHARSGKLLGTFVHAPLAGVSVGEEELREFDRSDVVLAPARPKVLASVLLEHKELLAKCGDLRASGLDEQGIQKQLNEELRERWLRKTEMEESQGQQPTPCPPEISLADVTHALTT